MEGNGRRLAWIAIALSALALVVSLGGRMAPTTWHAAYAPQGPFMQGPQGNGGPQDRPGPQGNVAPRGPRMGPIPQEEQRFEREFRHHGPFGGPRHFGPGMFFFGALGLIGKLFKLALVVLLIWLGLRLLQGRGFGGPRGSGPRGSGGGDRPGPEQPPYTGETQQM